MMTFIVLSGAKTEQSYLELKRCPPDTQSHEHSLFPTANDLESG